MNIDTTNAPNTTETAIGFIPYYRLPFLSLFHADCMEIMKQYPDKYFDLAIVDPPYDFTCSKTLYVNKNIYFKSRFQRFGGEKDKGGFVVGGNRPNALMKPPGKEYFDELIRVSKNQIIWGGQTFANLLPNSMEWIFWDKRTGTSYFADGELAWTSFGGSVRMYRPNKLKAQNKIHPTQKPEELYDWIFKRYAKEGNLILDTHLGSGSIALAVDKANRLDKMNLHLTACEIDKEYIDKAIKRISESIKQGTLSF
jgi:site-specific DNA-methyltransferase (adenine-specific)